jgi:hypothetical protein
MAGRPDGPGSIPIYDHMGCRPGRGARPRRREDPHPRPSVRFRAGGRDQRRRGRGARPRRRHPRPRPPVHPGGEPEWQTRDPRLRRRPRAPGPGRARVPALQPGRPAHQARVPGHDRRLQQRPPRRRLGPRRRLVHVGLPRRQAERRRPGPGDGRPARLPAQPGPPQRLGERRRAGPGRDHRAPPTRPTAGSSATRPGSRSARSTTARCAWSRTTSPHRARTS